MRQIIHDFTIIWRAMKTVILCTKVIELTQNSFTEVYKSGDTYDAVAGYQRFATVNGGSYPYSYANRYTTHRAVNERNNEVRAYIIDLGWTTYSPDANYYGNIDAIADDAYEAFLY